MFPRGSVVLLGALLFAGPATALDRADRCEADKLRAAGDYYSCRMRAEWRAVRKGGAPDYSQCVSKFGSKWGQAETRSQGMCPTSGDEADINTEISEHSDLLAELLHDPNYEPPGCGNSMIEGDEQCDGADLGGADCSSLGYTAGGTLSCTPGCAFDTSLCVCASAGLIVTGQTMSYTPGDDGEIQAGIPFDYVDNGDGTITDLNTGLMWEKKSDDAGLHDWDNIYPWDPNDPGSIWSWIDQVNTEGGTGFAGYDDWRIPNVRELQSIADYEAYSPAVPPIFNTGCLPGCPVETCSCTASWNYWTSSTSVSEPSKGWVVGGVGGGIDRWKLKTVLNAVRAVRGGL
jgi:hypothetical protein